MIKRKLGINLDFSPDVPPLLALDLISKAGFESTFTLEYDTEMVREIKAKADSLDLGLIRDASVLDYEDLPDPIESGEECIAQLEEAVDLLKSVVRELQSLTRAEA